MRFAIIIMALASACGFKPVLATGDDDGGSGSDLIDAAVPDGNDAMAANGRRKPITFVQPASCCSI